MSVQYQQLDSPNNVGTCFAIPLGRIVVLVKGLIWRESATEKLYIDCCRALKAQLEPKCKSYIDVFFSQNGIV